MRLLLISFLLTMNTAFAQSYYKGLTLTNHKVTINYPDHTVTAYTKPVMGNLFPDTDKYYYWYSANRIQVTQGGFSGKLLNGDYTDYYRNKNLREQGKFENGLKLGAWLSWHDSGSLKERINWRSGSKNGRFYRYDTAGKMAERGKYRADRLNGKVFTYSGKDSVITVQYRKGIAYKPKKVKLFNSVKRMLRFKKREGKMKEVSK